MSIFQSHFHEETEARLLRRPRLLVPRIHEGASSTLRSQIRIVHRRPLCISLKSAHQPWVRPELRRTTIKLSCMAQHDPSSPMHGLHQPTDLHVHVSVLFQLAHIAAVLPKAHNSELALRIKRLWRAHVQESRPIRKLHNFIYMCRNANVFVEIILRRCQRQTGFRSSCEADHRTKNKDQRNSPHRRRSFWGIVSKPTPLALTKKDAGGTRYVGSAPRLACPHQLLALSPLSIMAFDVLI